ncbi:hypothetical protein CRE_04367 [Caenorhabditis remanei]|uniref:F-box domain-containing protein n=1 Tax=Caenorhabditis remanei TaxID=31234 RepID=E3NIC3_CAERE|nr:hypothetical protein CRE_04367 [Caenorhabditis remanei]
MSLLKLPDDLLLEISGNLNLRGISNFRKVNPQLRSLLTALPPTKNFSSITVAIEQEVMTSIFESKGAHHEAVAYIKRDDGCQVNGKLFPGQDFVDFYIRDLEINLRYQKGVLDDFIVIQEDGANDSAGKVSNILESRVRPLATRSLLMQLTNSNQVSQFLSHLDVSSLERIHINGKERYIPFRFEEFEHLEQWRAAKSFYSTVYHENSQVFSHLLHFKKAEISVDNLFMRDLLAVRDAILSSRLTEFTVHYVNFAEEEEFKDLLEVETDQWPRVHFKVRRSFSMTRMSICLTPFQ